MGIMVDSLLRVLQDLYHQQWFTCLVVKAYCFGFSDLGWSLGEGVQGLLHCSPHAVILHSSKQARPEISF